MGVIEKQSIQDIADAIRDRNGLTTLYKPRQMDEAIRGLYKTEAVNHIFDNLTVSTTVQGSNLTITDADTTKQASITELKGNTTQEGTPTPSSPIEVKTVSGDNNIVVSNKNLLPTIDWTGTKNGCPIALSSDNTFSSNGTGSSRVLLGIDLISGATANYGLYVNANANARKITLQAGTYTLSISNVQGTLENVGENFFVVAKYREGQSTGLVIKQTNFSSMPMTFTLTEETEVFIAYQVQYTSANNYSFNFMLEEGNQATSYIAHQGNSYRVDLGGKNIFNIEQAITRMENNAGTLVNGWGTYEDGILTMNRSMGYHGTTCFAGQKFNLEANKTYTLSAIVYLTGTNATSNVILGFAGESNPNVTITKETWTKVSRTVTYTEYKENMRAFIQPSNTGNILQIKEIMLCEGTDTEYSPYTANPIELCKIR